MIDQQESDVKNYDYHHPRGGRILSGFVLIGFGLIFLAKQLGILFPEWLFTWPVFLIALGIYVGAKHLFRNPGWIFMVLVGSVFLISDVFPEFEFQKFLWPLLFIVAGLLVVFKPFKGRVHRFNRFHNRYNRRGAGPDEQDKDYARSYCERASDTDEDMLESVTILGGVKKNVLSKNFKGGEVICIMGGAEINLSQADIQGTVALEMIQIFGGAKLIVPANWEIRSEAMVILGGIEDKRAQMIDRAASQNKILIIKGTCVFGGIDIRSY